MCHLNEMSLIFHELNRILLLVVLVYVCECVYTCVGVYMRAHRRNKERKMSKLKYIPITRNRTK